MKYFTAFILCLICTNILSQEIKELVLQTQAVMQLGPFSPPTKGTKIRFKHRQGFIIRGTLFKLKDDKIYVNLPSGDMIAYKIRDVADSDRWKFFKSAYDKKLDTVVKAEMTGTSSPPKKPKRNIRKELMEKRRFAALLKRNNHRPAFDDYNFGDSFSIILYKIKQNKIIKLTEDYKDKEFKRVVVGYLSFGGLNCFVSFLFNNNKQLYYIEFNYKAYDILSYSSKVKSSWSILRSNLIKHFGNPSTDRDFPKYSVSLDAGKIRITNKWKLRNKTIELGIAASDEREYSPAIIISMPDALNESAADSIRRDFRNKIK